MFQHSREIDVSKRRSVIQKSLHAVKTSDGGEIRSYMGVSGLLHAPAALFSRKELPAPTVLEAGSTPAQVWTYWNKYMSYLCHNSLPVQPVV
jgi:hypothetical protein